VCERKLKHCTDYARKIALAILRVLNGHGAPEDWDLLLDTVLYIDEQGEILLYEGQGELLTEISEQTGFDLAI
jgi:hypothetical protein